jgi:subtilisin family serine protease
MFQQNIVPVISAGNDGPGANTIGGPAVAKGAFTVGAIFDDHPDYVDRVTDYSSRGTTGDSRVKPDVVAPGSWIDSTSNTNNSGYLYDWNGTSMAAPHVAGLVAGMIGHYNFPRGRPKQSSLPTRLTSASAPPLRGGAR